MEPQTFQQNTIAQPAQSPQKKKGILGLVMMLLLGLAVGAGVVVLLWLYWPKAATPQSNNTTSSNTARTGSSSSNSGTNSSSNSGSSSNLSSSSTSTAPPLACAFKDLTLSVGTTDGTAGTIYQHMVLTNKGTQTCTIAGYPAVYLLDSTKATLGSGAIPMTTYTPTLLSLVPGATAHTAVGFPQAANFAAGTCTANGAAIRVYLPGSTSYLDATLAKPYCPGFSATAVVAGE